MTRLYSDWSILARVNLQKALLESDLYLLLQFQLRQSPHQNASLRIEILPDQHQFTDQFGLCFPLFIIVATGVIKSYPWASNLLYKVTGTEPLWVAGEVNAARPQVRGSLIPLPRGLKLIAGPPMNWCTT